MATNKDTLNIRARGYVKRNKVDGKIIVVLPEVPASMYLDDLLFIVTVPTEDEQLIAPAYIRLQSKNPDHRRGEEVKDFTEVKTIGKLRQKAGTLMVIDPKIHTKVDLDKMVLIVTVPGEGKMEAPCYFKKRTYNAPPRRYESKQVKEDDFDNAVVWVDGSEPEDNDYDGPDPEVIDDDDVVGGN